MCASLHAALGNGLYVYYVSNRLIHKLTVSVKFGTEFVQIPCFIGLNQIPTKS